MEKQETRATEEDKNDKEVKVKNHNKECHSLLALTGIWGSAGVPDKNATVV